MLSLPVTGHGPHNACMRWQYRIAELITRAGADVPPRLRGRMRAPDRRPGIAWIETFHLLLLNARARMGRSAGRTDKRLGVLAPTECGVHPSGGVTQALRQPGLPIATMGAAVAALKRCLEFVLTMPDQGAAHA